MSVNTVYIPATLKDSEVLAMKMGAVAIRIWQLAVVFLFLSAGSSSYAVMTTPASWSVNPSGGFTYEVPFRLPPGIADVKPKISLVYSSQSGNGLAGVGWGLSGLSAINRCARTFINDGIRGGVNIDANDRLCLDGQRLVLASGSYGAEGATYRTEIYNGARILGTALASTNTARTFKVYTKAGELMEYSPFSDASGTVALQFVLSRVTDAKGNYWQAYYQSNTATGEIYPKAICYTGNSRLAQTPKNCIEFGYGSDTARFGTPVARTDKMESFLNGNATRLSQRLAGVRTLINAAINPSGSSWALSGTAVTEYRLSYGTYVHLARSQLRSVQECAGTACLPANSFTYSEQLDLAVEPTSRTYSSMSSGVLGKADFNGDGRTDIYAIPTDRSYTNLEIFLSREDGNFDYKAVGYDSPGIENGLNYPVVGPSIEVTADVNGDAKADLIFIKSPGTTDCTDSSQNPYLGVALSKGDGTFQPTIWKRFDFIGIPACGLEFQPGVPEISSGDFDGDGIEDLYLSGNVLFFDKTGNAKFTSSPQAWRHKQLGLEQIRADYTGDGKTDLLTIGPSTVQIETLDANRIWVKLPSVPITSLGVTSGERRLQYGDFNGDGKSDVLFFATGTDVKVWLSRGNGTFELKNAAPGQTFNASTNDYRFLIADFNADGLTDLAQALSPTQIQFWAARGDGTFSVMPPSTYSNYNFSSNFYNIMTVDLDGDGKSGFLHNLGPNVVRLIDMSPKSAVTLKMTKVTNGPNVTQVEYSHLSSSNSYQITPVTPPDRVIARGSYPIVTAVSLSNGLGGMNRQEYRWGTGLLEPYSGRGFMGFEWMETQMKGADGVWGHSERTTFAQAWPCVGMTLKTQGFLPGGGFKSLGDNFIQVRTPASAVPNNCGAAALNGQVVIPYVAEAWSRQWEMNSNQQQGVELPRQRTLVNVDAYGNPTQIQEFIHNPDGSASGYSKTTTNTFDANAEKARLGRVIRSQVVHNKP